MRVTVEEAQKKLGDLVADAVAGSEQAQQTMVDGIPPFLLPYQCIFRRIITRRELRPVHLIGGMTGA